MVQYYRLILSYVAVNSISITPYIYLLCACLPIMYFEHIDTLVYESVLFFALVVLRIPLTRIRSILFIISNVSRRQSNIVQ